MKSKDELKALFQTFFMNTEDGEDVFLDFDNEVLNWVSDSEMEEEGYDEDDWYGYYIDHSHGEAEDVVIENITNTFMKNASIELSLDEKSILREIITEEYDALNY